MKMLPTLLLVPWQSGETLSSLGRAGKVLVHSRARDTLAEKAND